MFAKTSQKKNSRFCNSSYGEGTPSESMVLGKRAASGMNQPKNEVVSVSLARDIVFQLYYNTNKSGHVGQLGQVLEISKNDIILK